MGQKYVIIEADWKGCQMTLKEYTEELNKNSRNIPLTDWSLDYGQLVFDSIFKIKICIDKKEIDECKSIKKLIIKRILGSLNVTGNRLEGLLEELGCICSLCKKVS